MVRDSIRSLMGGNYMRDRFRQYRRFLSRGGLFAVVFGVMALLAACTTAPSADGTMSQPANLPLDASRPTFIYFYTPT